MKHSVLLVDDDLSVRESLRQLFHAEGYQVVMAVNGVEAVEKFGSAQQPIDLMLLDLNMPLRNGWATLDRLFEVDPSLPVMVLTGLPNQYALAKAAGISALVEKPVDVEAMLLLMQELLSDPTRLRHQGIGRWNCPFHHLLAAGRVSRGPWPEQHVTPYRRGGINE